jgi:hypothetical protein
MDFLVPDTVPMVRIRANPPGRCLVAPHWPYRREHLEHVATEMIGRGSCRIRGWFDGRDWRAIEGSHRIWTASRLGVVIDLQSVELEDTFDHDQPEVGRITVRHMLEVRLRTSSAFYPILP